MTQSAAMITWPKVLKTLLFDAGETLVYLDSEVVAKLVLDQGLPSSSAAVEHAKPAARRSYAQAIGKGASHDDGWRIYIETLLEKSGVEREQCSSIFEIVKAEHNRFNLWRRVPTGLPGRLQALRDQGVRLGIVSNSEGGLVDLLERVQLKNYFDMVIDSAEENGVCKPNPEIFERALTRMDADVATTMYVGDIPEVDIAGANAANIAAALIDATGLYSDYTGAKIFPTIHAFLDQLAPLVD